MVLTPKPLYIGHTLPQIKLLKDTIPSWVKVVSKQNDGFKILAEPPLPSGQVLKKYKLSIVKRDSRVLVSESSVGTNLPSCCPERHINSDGTFCIGYNIGQSINGPANAQNWWEALLKHLCCQYLADRQKTWPVGQGLSHGDAALVQMKMEKLAKPLGWFAEVQLALVNKGWLGGDLPRERNNSGQLVNGRSVCPRGCHHQHFPFPKFGCGKDICPVTCPKQHNNVLRKPCPNSEIVTQLVLLEKKRRKKERAFFESYEGVVCCGSMKHCPLKS